MKLEVLLEDNLAREIDLVHETLAKLNPQALQLIELARESGDTDIETRTVRRWENIGRALRTLSRGEANDPGPVQ